MWDETRADHLKMEKKRPGSSGSTRLTVQGYFAAFRANVPTWPRPVCYEIVEASGIRPLTGVQWADWDHDGRLLVATTDGKLQVRHYSETRLSVIFEVSLADLVPSPSPPPAEAHRW